jgi:hypothetical protein
VLPEQLGPDDEWFVTHVSSNAVPLGRDIVLGTRGQSLRHLKIEKVVSYLTARAASARTPGTRARGDMAVWKGTRICAYLRAKLTDGFDAYKIE